MRRAAIADLLRPKALLVYGGFALFVAFVAFLAAIDSPTGAWRHQSSVIGHTRGAFMPQSKYSLNPLSASIELEGGELVTVMIPRQVAYRHNAPVRLKAYHYGAGERTRVRYEFDEFVEHTPGEADASPGMESDQRQAR